MFAEMVGMVGMTCNDMTFSLIMKDLMMGKYAVNILGYTSR